MRIIWGLGVLAFLGLILIAFYVAVIGTCLVVLFLLIRAFLVDPLVDRWERRNGWR